MSIRLFSAFVFWMLTSPCSALSNLDYNYKLELGGYWAQINSNLGAYAPVLNTSKVIDFEDSLLLNQSKFSPNIALEYRINRKHAVRLHYNNLYREGVTESSSEDFGFTWGGDDYIIKQGTQLASTLNIDIYQLTYEYTLVDSPQNTLLLSTGLHTMQLYIHFLGNLKHQIDGNPDLTEALNEADVAEKVTAPVPNLGIVYSHHLTENWHLNTSSQWFRVVLNDLQGRLMTGKFGVEYSLVKSVNMALNYQFYRLDFNHSADYSYLALEFLYHGPQLEINFQF